MQLFDSHIHCQHLPMSVRYSEPCLIPAVSPQDWQPLLDRWAQPGRRWVALGLHPYHAASWNESLHQQLAAMLSRPQVAAVGEIGLDGRLAVDQSLQESALRQQLQLAVAAGKPVILHAVRCFDRLLSLLDQEQVARVGGVVHGFSGSVELAAQLWRRGFAIGIGRLILNPKARRLAQVVATLPAEALVLETDAPWPGDRSGADDWSQVLRSIAMTVAEARGWSLEQVAAITTTNSCRQLGLAPNSIITRTGESP